MITLIAALFLGSWLPAFSSEKSTIELSTPSQDISFPVGCEKICTNHISYPCPDYKQEVIKEGFIMSTSQVAHLFGALSQEDSFSFPPDDEAHYLVMRVKNTGSLPARGIIKCQISSEYFPFNVQISHLKPHMETFAHYVIPLQSFSPPTRQPVKDDDRFIHLEWDTLSIILDLEQK